MAVEHQWPAELTADAACEICGLAYDQWAEEDTTACAPPSSTGEHPCVCHSCTNIVAYADEQYCFGCERPAFCQCGCGCGQ